MTLDIAQCGQRDNRISWPMDFRSAISNNRKCGDAEENYYDESNARITVVVRPFSSFIDKS